MTMAKKSEYDFRLKPTEELYDSFQKSYEYLNWRLFDNKLPNCLITLQRRQNTYGYFAGNRFRREDGVRSDEIALNPAHFRDRQPEEVLSTLVHEMVHLYQHHFGEPGRGRYHNREWAETMKKVGLQPTASGEAGGKETGDKMSHFTISNGAFEIAVNELFERGLVLEWTEVVNREDGSRNTASDLDGDTQKSGKRIKYTCNLCRLNVWAKHGAQVDCHQDKVLMKPQG